MNAIRRLSELGGAITDAETYLQKIKVTTEEFVVARERLVGESIANLLDSSKGMLGEIAKNHEKVNSFANGVDDLSKNLEMSFESLEHLASIFLAYMEKSEEYIAGKHVILNMRVRELNVQRLKIDSDVEANRQRTATLSKWQTRLHSKEDSIRGALKVLTNKQKNA